MRKASSAVPGDFSRLSSILCLCNVSLRSALNTVLLFRPNQAVRQGRGVSGGPIRIVLTNMLGLSMSEPSENMSSSQAIRTYHSHRWRFALIPALSITSLLLPVLIFWIAVPNAPRAGLVLSLIFVPIGTGLLLVGIAFLRLFVEVSRDALTVRLPAAGTEPWFPWLVKQATIPWTDVTSLAFEARDNPYARGRTERFAELQTEQGSFRFSSIWFPEFDALVADLQVNAPQLVDSTTTCAEAELANGEQRWLRRFAWTAELIAIGAILVLGVCTLAGHGEHVGTLCLCLTVLYLARPAFELLRSKRRAF